MRHRHFKTALQCFVVLLLAVSAVRAEETRLKLSECPSAVQQTFVAEAKGSHLETVVKATEGEATVYAARVSIGGKRYEITVDDDGTLLDKTLDEEIVESEVTFDKAPAEVQKTLRDEAEGDEIKVLNKTAQGNKTLYETDVVIGGKDYWLVVDGHGRLIEKRMGFEIEEDKIDLDDAPAAVQQTLKRIAQGADIVSLYKTTENAKSEYDTEIEIGGREYAVRVGDDGTLIEKSLHSSAEEEDLDLADVPRAVERTLREEARGADIEVVVKKTAGDESLYGISIELGGKAYWIIVDADGLLVSKELDE